MKPDTRVCKNCGKEINRGTWCSDKCRKAYVRNPDKDTPKSDKNPDKPNPDTQKSDKFRNSLTNTDKTFYDRALRDFKGNPYYRFGEINPAERNCILESCGKSFKTSLKLLNYCSYDHYREAIGGRK